MDKKNKPVSAAFRNYSIIIISLISAAIISLIAAVVTSLIITKHINNIDEAAIKYAGEKEVLLLYISVGITVLSLIFAIVFFMMLCKRAIYPVKQIVHNMEEIGIAEYDSIKTNDIKQIVPECNEIKEIFDRYNSLIDLIMNLNKNHTFKDILLYIYNSFSEYLPYTHIGVALIDSDTMNIKFLYNVSDKKHRLFMKKFIGYNTPLKDTSLVYVIGTGKERVINDLEEYIKDKPQKPYNQILLDAGIKSSIAFPLKNNDRAVGIIFFSSDKKNVYKKEHIQFISILAGSITLGLEKSILFDDMIVSSIQALARLAEQRDPETGEHLARIGRYSRLLAELLSQNRKYEDTINDEYINNIERFSTLHDIGKVGIRDDILLKQGRLSPEEFAVMKTHTIYGAWVLKNADENLIKRGRSIFKMGIEIAEGHHEKWNGTGYPYGKAGKDIPLCARIVAAADVFDALTSKRPYKPPLPFDESCKLIISEAGKHFDPDIAELFNICNDKIRFVYEGFVKSGLF